MSEGTASDSLAAMVDATVPISTPAPVIRAPDERNIGLDLAALLAIGLTILLYHVLVPDLRENSPTGQAFSSDSLRRVVTIIFGFLGIAVFVGDRGLRASGIVRLIRRVAGMIVGLDVLYIASFIFLGMELATDTILPTIAEIATLISLFVLWQPWDRLALYRKQAARLLPPIAIVLALLILWELTIAAFNIQRFLLPAPSVILAQFVSVYPRLIGQGWITFQNALWGYAIGCGAGVLFALITARFTGFSRALMPYAVAINSIPIIAFAPITNAWFGVLNPLSKISIVAILTFFPAMINTVRGLLSADANSLELMRSVAASEWDIFRKLRLPVALPFIFNGLKISTSLSMIGAIVAEYFGGPIAGLGVQINSNAALIRFPLVWSQIIIASLCGIIFYFVVSLAERLIMPWHITFRPPAN
jgi:NitT/TauT family transport system permease protein